MFRRFIKRSNFNFKNADCKIENLNDRVNKCQSDVDVIYICMAISACFSIGTVFIKEVFVCNK
jgi:hypothetical protein